MIKLPKNVAMLLERIEQEGHTAWVVGGSVRDSLRGDQPNDWDLATSAHPQTLLYCLQEFDVRPTGLQHGTVTVYLEGKPYEITTYRQETDYSDGRHPDAVAFVQDIETDLARRDFTMNAMAWHPKRGLCDPFGGQEDLKNGLIRAVGKPQRRFTEDALRILRGLRFVSRTGFVIEPKTATAMWNCTPLLQQIAPERIQQELSGILTGRYVGRVLRAYPWILAQIFPEIAPMMGHHQHNPHHKFDIWEHTVRAVESAPADLVLRMTMLLHDCGKPAAYTLDDWGIGHFYGHPEKSAEIATRLLERLRFSHADRDRILRLIEYHDYPLGEDVRVIRRRLAEFGERDFRALLQIKKCDSCGKLTVPQNLEELDRTARLVDESIASNVCLSLRQLAIRGNDLTALGLYGRQIGEMLQQLLDRVVDGTLANERDVLVAFVKKERSS